MNVDIVSIYDFDGFIAGPAYKWAPALYCRIKAINLIFGSCAKVTEHFVVSIKQREKQSFSHHRG